MNQKVYIGWIFTRPEGRYAVSFNGQVTAMKCLNEMGYIESIDHLEKLVGARVKTELAPVGYRVYVEAEESKSEVPGPPAPEPAPYNPTLWEKVRQDVKKELAGSEVNLPPVKKDGYTLGDRRAVVLVMSRGPQWTIKAVADNLRWEFTKAKVTIRSMVHQGVAIEIGVDGHYGLSALGKEMATYFTAYPDAKTYSGMAKIRHQAELKKLSIPTVNIAHHSK